MPTDRLASARAALARGDVLVAYDAARIVLDDFPDDLAARFLLALSLARAGSTEHASQELAELVRRIGSGEAVDTQLREDADALAARLVKDRALVATGPRRLELAARAADLYEAAADRHGGSFSCINAATLRVIAGDTDAARVLARQARDIIETGPAADRNSYWQLATLAEVALVLDDLDAARPALERAAQAAGDDVAARAVTRRQLQVLCAAQGIDASILDVLAPSTVLHYCGHRLDEHDAITRFPAALESRVAAQIAQYLDDRSVGFAYGSLASGADTLVAEAVLDRGIELHVVLPFDADDFETTSVASAGRAWSARYRACLARATSVSCASDSAYLGDRELFGYNSRIAMGHAIKRAAFLGVAVEQLAIWDGLPGEPGGGTAHDVEVWRRAGRATHVIPLDTERLPATGHTEPARVGARSVYAILFGDFHGFSRLRDEQFAAFTEHVLGALARVLKRYGDAIEYRNSWGDAIELIVRDVQSAAVCALELQEAVEAIDLAAIGLPADLALRIGGHAGPVVAIPDPIRDGEPTYWGRELTRAARIEPNTPIGDVYVTDAFAALLALEPNCGSATEYVGRVTTAKEFETIPMYRLRRATT